MRWFQQNLYGHDEQALSIEKVLYHWRTEFQDVLIFENASFGKVLVLDGIVQLTERDAHIHHEMIAHVPLMAHGSARDVLIIGGGDGGALREVLKTSVKTATLVEFDDEVIDLLQRYLPEVSDGAFDDRRASVVVMDGARYIAETGKKFDAIIIDTADPMGPGETPFTTTFYEACRNRLRPGGVIALRCPASFLQPGERERVCKRLSGSFAEVRPYLAPVPTYASGMLAFVVAGNSRDALCPSTETLRERFSPLQGRTRYYTPEVHQAAFTLVPSFTPIAPQKEPVPATNLKMGS